MTAAKKADPAEMKRREKALFGEFQVWFGLEADRVEPGGISAPEVKMMKREKKIGSSASGGFILLSLSLDCLS